MLEVNNFIVAGEFFLIILGELVIIFVVVAFIIGLLMEYLPPSRIREFLSNKMIAVQYFLGAALGALTPFCSCSTVPITAGLLKGGVPFGPTMAFLFSSPVLNPVIIALLLSLFGIQVTVIYVVVTFTGSMLTAFLLTSIGMENQLKPLINIENTCCPETAKENYPNPSEHTITEPLCGCNSNIPTLQNATLSASRQCCPTEPRLNNDGIKCCSSAENHSNPTNTIQNGGFSVKIKRAALSAVDIFKGVFWYLLLGAAIGALIYGFFPKDLVMKLAGPDNNWAIPVAAAIGIPMYIRAETILPISAALVGKGMGLGAVIALVIGGAGASIPEIIILNSLFKPKLVAAFCINVFVIAVLSGLLIDAWVY